MIRLIRTLGLFSICLILSLQFMGCGGGGGSSNTASNNDTSNTNPTEPQQNIPNASIATVIQGIIAINFFW